MFESRKIYQGYSTCFRQWRAENTHCRFLHGYAVSFEVTFKGDLDHRNWVYDFGGFKRSLYKVHGMNMKQYFDWLFDHTVIVAEDDPFLKDFLHMHNDELIQLRTLPAVGCEMFAKHVYDTINEMLKYDTMGRVEVESVIFRENEKNSAVYYGE